MAKDLSSHRGASALVLSGELTEGVSDLSHARTAPGGVPALPEVNQDRAHPDSPEVEEQPRGNYRRIHPSGNSRAAWPWTTVSPSSRGPAQRGPGPAQTAAKAERRAVNARVKARQSPSSEGKSNA
jgi:hypothetical protein